MQVVKEPKALVVDYIATQRQLPQVLHPPDIAQIFRAPQWGAAHLKRFDGRRVSEVLEARTVDVRRDQKQMLNLLAIAQACEVGVFQLRLRYVEADHVIFASKLDERTPFDKLINALAAFTRAPIRGIERGIASACTQPQDQNRDSDDREQQCE
ncbi:MAG TPA: hypothetical protein VGY55_15670 [Pirellulales bacterium]|nr:hypothetical protein [Pirellulales bacterium]